MAEQLKCLNYPATDWRAVPRSNWTCEQWKSYYGALKKATGKQNADANFVRAWKSFGVSGTGCDRNTDFYNYFKKQGIDVSSGSLEMLWNETKNYGENLYNTIKWAGYAISAIILLTIAYLLYKILQDPARVGAAVATRGLSEVGRK